VNGVPIPCCSIRKHRAFSPQGSPALQSILRTPVIHSWALAPPARNNVVTSKANSRSNIFAPHMLIKVAHNVHTSNYTTLTTGGHRAIDRMHRPAHSVHKCRNRLAPGVLDARGDGSQAVRAAQEGCCNGDDDAFSQ
jgi:hypothetical protein